MSATTSTPTPSEPDAPVGADGTPATSEAPSPTPAQETDWKAESRKWESLAKKNKDAAARLAEIEEANKSEEQKRAEREAALQTELNEYKTREQVASWAKEITKDSHVPADLLRGSTREELAAHFEQLKSLIPTQAQPNPHPVVPLAGGPKAPSNLTIQEQIAAAEEAGDKTLVATLKAAMLSQKQ